MALVPTWQFYLDRMHFNFCKCNSFCWSSRIPLARAASGPQIQCYMSGCFPRRIIVLNETKKVGRGIRVEPRAIVDYNRSDGERKPIQRIVEKLKNRGQVDEVDAGEVKGREWNRGIKNVSKEDASMVSLFPISSSKGSHGETDNDLKIDEEVLFPWEKPNQVNEDGEERWSARSKSRTYLAELTLPDSELRRLRNMTFQIKSRVKIKGSGITEEVISAIREKWNTSELVRIKVDGAPALNMKRMHEIVEKKTGGLVIWRSGTSMSLYRGVSYQVPQDKKTQRGSRNAGNRLLPEKSIASSAYSPDEEGEHSTTDDFRAKLHPEINYEEEVDKLLDELGPRYTDWSGCDPLPIDADMLPGIVPDFNPPYRILPYGVRGSLSRQDATSLRRLAKSLPPHFALGRSRQLQGLAVAMIKLWERSSIAKIALKRGVENTTSERMAEQIKNLTGGMLLSRNKDFLVFYRGKNFLSQKVCDALLEREDLAKSFQDEEEQARLRASAFIIPKSEATDEAGCTGTLEETLNANSKWGKKLDEKHTETIMREAAIARHNMILRKLEKKLEFAQRRIAKAGVALSKVEAFLAPTGVQADPDIISDEERYMFRKIGLRMKAFLLLGRRGVFDGTVENMHLHWKYRELVKIVFKAQNFEDVKDIALALEAESGGVLVSVDKVSKGYAIVVFRGKDYKRPSTIRPNNLLSKRRALARSIEIQRREALMKHVASLQSRIDKLASEIEDMNSAKNEGNNELYDRIDSFYKTDDEETEEDGNDAYLEIYQEEHDNTEDYHDDQYEDAEEQLEVDFSNYESNSSLEE